MPRSAVSVAVVVLLTVALAQAADAASVTKKVLTEGERTASVAHERIIQHG